MAEGKWISDLKATTPLTDAARHVLAVRLEKVRDHLPLALTESDKDPEHVHQLRVATRRASAALDIFAPCLPDKVYKSARRQLRRIRRAAGEARDWDVFLLAVMERAGQQKPSHQSGLDFLLGYSVAQRLAAQTHLETANRDYPFDFDRFLAETVAAVHRPRDAPEVRTLLDLARPLLSNLIKELDQAAARDLEDYGNLHQVRIVGKRLRYSMEVFADCFAPPFRQALYPAVEEMQEILGRANDSHVAAHQLSVLRERVKALMPGKWKRYKAGVEGLLRAHQQRLPQERQQFLEWWSRWRESGAEEMLARLVKPAEA
jgi:CHAD domain-containing protein